MAEVQVSGILPDSDSSCEVGHFASAAVSWRYHRRSTAKPSLSCMHFHPNDCCQKARSTQVPESMAAACRNGSRSQVTAQAKEDSFRQLRRIAEKEGRAGDCKPHATERASAQSFLRRRKKASWMWLACSSSAKVRCDSWNRLWHAVSSLKQRLQLPQMVLPGNCGDGRLVE